MSHQYDQLFKLLIIGDSGNFTVYCFSFEFFDLFFAHPSCHYGLPGRCRRSSPAGL